MAVVQQANKSIDEDVRKKRNIQVLLVGISNGTATSENSLIIS